MTTLVANARAPKTQVVRKPIEVKEEEDKALGVAAGGNKAVALEVVFATAEAEDWVFGILRTTAMCICKTVTLFCKEGTLWKGNPHLTEGEGSQCFILPCYDIPLLY